MSTCLIVDDSRVIRKVARAMLAALGYDCNDAENGRLALDACKAALPDFILVDLEMPVMNGLDFLRSLRHLPGGDKPVVVFCTAEKDLRHIQEALAAGANEYIMKPFDSDIVRSKLEQLEPLMAKGRAA